jgi:uncharacterized protein YbjT (DUF2867 family)
LAPILVVGATGKLGRLVTRQLLDRNVPVRVLARQPDAARALFGSSVEIAAGDLDDAETLAAAAKGIECSFLLSPISEHLSRQQSAFVDAAVQAGVRRIVKVSGSHWTIDPPGRSISGDAHAAVERHIEAQKIEWVALRPTAWMQVSLPPLLAAAAEGWPLYSAYGDAGVAFIDARDIAATAVHQLLADRLEIGPLVLTGGESLTVQDIAARAGRLLDRKVEVTGERPAGFRPPFPPESFHGRAVAEFMVLIRGGAASALTGTVGRLLGRPALTVDAFLAEQLRAVAA